MKDCRLMVTDVAWNEPLLNMWDVSKTLCKGAGELLNLSINQPRIDMFANKTLSFQRTPI